MMNSDVNQLWQEFGFFVHKIEGISGVGTLNLEKCLFRIHQSQEQITSV
jgi:hypothetical protein